jgi:hypothetical protein
MGLAEDITEIGQMIDAFDARYPACHVVVDEPGREHPPLDMRAERLSSPDWVACKVLHSALCETDIVAVEREFGVELPPVFRAYLLARFHLHDQVHGRRHNNQLIFWPPVPSRDSLDPLREHLRGWPVLIEAGYIPFAEWGDGWGPMSFDAAGRRPDGDCPVVWMDHELLFRVGVERCRVRANVEPLAQRVYDSCRELINDVFTCE